MIVWTPLREADLRNLELHPAGGVDLRRDLYLFAAFVRREGLKRSHRGNTIPKGPALKLAKILSWAGETEQVASEGDGSWSDYVSRLALRLGLVSFDEKGVYAGYSSHEPSFPDNHVKVNDAALASWLAATPLDKERRIFESLLETTPSEFFHRPTLFPGDPRFDAFGSATGPHQRMQFPVVRRRLLEILATLPVGEWLPLSGLVEHVKNTARSAILSPDLKRKPLSDWELAQRKRGAKIPEKVVDLYENFAESPDERHRRDAPRALTEATPDAFERVEGRYLQYFLQQIPYLCGFVDLGLAKLPAKAQYGMPLKDRVRAFRLAPKLGQLLGADKAMNRVSVTVLPDFEVIVEAPSWPDRERDRLAPWCVLLKEEGPTHHLRIDQKQVVTWAAAQRDGASVALQLEQLSGRSLPANVAAELDAWCGHAEKLTVMENVAVVEVRAPVAEAEAVRGELGKLVVATAGGGFLITTDQDRTVAVLEQRQRVPRVIAHAAGHFGACDGPLGAPARSSRRASPTAPSKRRASLALEDLVGCSTDDPKLLAALREALEGAGCWSSGTRDDKVMVVRATDLPQVRAALRKLADRFDVSEDQ